MLKTPRTRLIIVRHGETEFNRQRRLHGVLDVPLCAEAHAHLTKLRDELARWRIECAFTSPLKRARETCRIALGDRLLPVRISPGLIERDFGEWEGKSFERIIAEQPDGGASLMYGPFVGRFLSGETDEAFFGRVKKYFHEELLVKARHRSVLVVGHAGFLMAMLAVAAGLDPRSHFATFRIENGSMTVLDWYDGIAHFLFVNRIF
jgi:broad specificity phosphatase PhoE